MMPSEPTAASPAAVVDVAPDPRDASGARGASFWSKLVNAASAVDEYLAEWFGMNQSKYQWAVDEFMDRQLAGDNQGTPTAPSKPPEGMEPTGQQVMQKDADRLTEV